VIAIADLDVAEEAAWRAAEGVRGLAGLGGLAAATPSASASVAAKTSLNCRRRNPTSSRIPNLRAPPLHLLAGQLERET